MHRLRIVAVAGMLVLLTMQAAGQGRDDGSLYSRYGLGELRSFPSSRAQAMGGGGVALWTRNYANFANPAALGWQFLVRASGGMRFDNITTTNASRQSKNLLVGSFSAIQFGVPLKTNRLGMGFAFEPFSRMNFKVTNSGTLPLDPTRDETPFTVVTQGTGGLQQVRIGIGARPASALSLGVSVDYLFGITEESRRTSFDSASLAVTNVATRTRMRGTAVTGGVLVALRMGEEGELSFGGRATLPAVLSARRLRTLGQSLDLDTLGTVQMGDISLPVRTAFGAAYTTQNRWTIAADVLHEPWTSFTSDVDLTGFAPGAMRDRTRISAGIEYLPAGSSNIETYLQRTAYRLGFFVDNAYISPVAGQTIATQAITAGLSLPTLFAGTRLDLNVQAGRRGRADGTLVRDQFVTVSATLNVGERWFLKRRLR